jgi:hypothetical protein
MTSLCVHIVVGHSIVRQSFTHGSGVPERWLKPNPAEFAPLEEDELASVADRCLLAAGGRSPAAVHHRLRWARTVIVRR